MPSADLSQTGGITGNVIAAAVFKKQILHHLPVGPVPRMILLKMLLCFDGTAYLLQIGF